jgi:hypothetical protein
MTVIRTMEFDDGSKVEWRQAWGIASTVLVEADGSERKTHTAEIYRLQNERGLKTPVPPEDVWTAPVGLIIDADGEKWCRLDERTAVRISAIVRGEATQ